VFVVALCGGCVGGFCWCVRGCVPGKSNRRYSLLAARHCAENIAAFRGDVSPPCSPCDMAQLTLTAHARSDLVTRLASHPRAGNLRMPMQVAGRCSGYVGKPPYIVVAWDGKLFLGEELENPGTWESVTGA